MGRHPRDVLADAVLQLEADDPAPAYVQLERRVRLAVADGTLQPGDRLPSVRHLAGKLGVALNTVGRAYAELAREGVIVARAGGGSEVAPRESLDWTELTRSRQERLRTLGTDAARLYAVVSALGGPRLVGRAAALSPGTFWRPSGTAT